MGRTKKNLASEPSRKLRPAISPEARENQMISLAYDAAERQLLEGTATSQVIVHFLKLGTEKEKLERERIAKENKLLEAKVDLIESAKHSEELYAEALAAMKAYSGRKDDEDDEDLQ